MHHPFNPANPASDFRAFLPDGKVRSAQQPNWIPADGILPALYLSHGAPPLYDDPVWIDELAHWAHSMPKPKAIVIVSAHWEAAPISISDPHAHQAPGVRYAHPTVEHFTPLFVALGAGSDGDLQTHTAIDGYMVGLSKRSLEVL